jgi:hypothetical protein
VNHTLNQILGLLGGGGVCVHELAQPLCDSAHTIRFGTVVVLLAACVCVQGVVGVPQGIVLGYQQLESLFHGHNLLCHFHGITSHFLFQR